MDDGRLGGKSCLPHFIIVFFLLTLNGRTVNGNTRLFLLLFLPKTVSGECNLLQKLLSLL